VKTILKHVRATCSLGVISCFVLFLITSAPHRVHHLFENVTKTHGHDRHAHPSIQSGTTSAVDRDTNDDDHSASPARAGTTHNDKNHDGTPQTVCLLQSAAQHSHFSASPLLEIAFLNVEFGEQSTPVSLPLSPFNLSPFSQRAPPQV
jgi:hypothetical protein